MIFGFMVAGFVATAVRSYAATSLALRAESVLSRGWAARSLAGSAAYFAEVPSFVGSVRLAHGVLGYDQGFGNLETLPGELGGAALFLGALKLSAAAAQSLLGNSLSRPLVHGMGTLGGIYLGHRMEETFGLRTPQVEMNRWFDVAETFLQLKVGGQLASSLHRTASSHLTMRLAALEAPTLRLATGGEWFHENHRPLDLAATFKNLENTAETQVRQDLEFETLRTRLGETLGPRATTMVVQMVQGIGRQMKVGDSLVQIVGGSQYPSIYGLEMAMRRINYAATYAFPRGLTGSYLNWVVRVAAESAIRRNDQARFDRLVAFLAEGASIDQLEALASELDPRLRLFPETLLARNLRIAEVMTLRGESHKKIRALPLSREAKQTLLAYVRIMAEENDRRRVAEVLGDWLRRNPDHKDIIQNILSRARLNPGGAMRAQRMMNVLMYEPSNLPKLRELYDADLGARGRGNLIPP
ncbi:MAG TPA: hypothetical protein VFW62_04780, partial [bacterium]|nr:hypothetical protein [bacterium]